MSAFSSDASAFKGTESDQLAATYRSGRSAEVDRPRSVLGVP